MLKDVPFIKSGRHATVIIVELWLVNDWYCWIKHLFSIWQNKENICSVLLHKLNIHFEYQLKKKCSFNLLIKIIIKKIFLYISKGFINLKFKIPIYNFTAKFKKHQKLLFTFLQQNKKPQTYTMYKIYMSAHMLQLGTQMAFCLDEIHRIIEITFT